jgi:hypothetical protein
MSWKNVSNWAPIRGRWKSDPANIITYEGPPGRGMATDFGNKFGACLSDVRFSEGTVKTFVRLPLGSGPEEPVRHDASAYLTFGLRQITQEYILAGLAGYESAYTIARFDPVGVTWRALASAGDRRNLNAEKDYEVDVRLQGQRVTLTIDGIQILETVIPAPIIDTQLGLVGWGEGPVTFRDTRVAQTPGEVFVVMQFSSPYDELFSEVIKERCDEFGLRAHRADEKLGPGLILTDIVKSIEEAKIIIAEITESNPNVFYELGYAHALKKPTILLADRNKRLPFDVSGYRCLFYDNSIVGKRLVDESLGKHLSAILNP